jgi:cell shape-determining protein MreC
MEVLYLPKNHAVEIGDRVFTSGDGDTLPPGLLIGVVQKVDKGEVSVAMIEDVTNANIVTILEY